MTQEDRSAQPSTHVGSLSGNLFSMQAVWSFCNYSDVCIFERQLLMCSAYAQRKFTLSPFSIVMTLPPDDYVEILNLYSKYNLSSDSGDAEGFADCFSKSGKIENLGSKSTVQGREDLVAYKHRDFASRAHIYRRHWNNNIHLEKLADGSVLGRCYLIAYNGDPGKVPELVDAGVYEDSIIKESGRWTFSHRRLYLDANTYKIPAPGSST